MIRLLIVFGQGGHSKEMVKLMDLLGSDYEYAYIMVDGDNLTESMLTIQNPIFRVVSPRGKEHRLLPDIWKTLKCMCQALKPIYRFRPKAMLSTGPGVAVPVALACKLMGVKLIFVETGSRVTSLSLTGRIMYRLADMFLVQWEPLLEKYPRAVYAGRLC